MASPDDSARPRRRTNAERSAATRSRLLEAAAACLIEHGYAGTTTVAVCRRSSVSHGSLLHHFGTRERLLGATLDAVYARLRGGVVAELEALPDGESRVRALVDLMWTAFGSPDFKVVIELWLAAANQPGVSWTVWPEARTFDAANAQLARRLFPEIAERLPDFEVYVSLLFQSMQGMGLAKATLPQSSEAESMRRRVRALLARLIDEAFAPAARAARV